MSGVVIVGAGLGSLRAAESLRAEGYTGPITVVGDEDIGPYNRPPLTKEALANGVDPAALEFRRKASVDDVVWLLGNRAVAASLDAGTVSLSDGSTLAFDGLVIASGIRPRRLPIPGPVLGRHGLRTVNDAIDVRRQLDQQSRLIVMGAGFIGCEIAATARSLGVPVSVVAMDEQPMVRPLGPELGSAMRRRHEGHGVRFHLGQTITSFDGSDRVEAVILDDGTALPATVVVEAVGSVANVEWLEGNDLDLSDGVLVDAGMKVAGTSAAAVAVGDVARHPNRLFPGPARRVEHWNMPTETGRRAGRTLAALLAGTDLPDDAFAGLPSFWSDQYEAKLQSFGMPGLGNRTEVVSGSVDDACVVEYHDDSGLVGVVSIDSTGALAPYRRALLDRN